MFVFDMHVLDWDMDKLSCVWCLGTVDMIWHDRTSWTVLGVMSVGQNCNYGDF